MAKSKYRTHHKAQIVEYFVMGGGCFPLDMLRYDCAWPATSEDVNRIDDQPDFHEPRSEFFDRQRIVRLYAAKEPTAERWASFGWRVYADETIARRVREVETERKQDKQ